MIEELELLSRKELWLQGYWEVPNDLDTSNFNFAWRPYMYDKPYIHQFGTQHQKTGGPKFIVPNSLGVKYHSDQVAIKLPNQESRSWRILVSNIEFDYSWHPDETDPPYIYVFGNQWYDPVTMPTLQYKVPGATEKKYVYDVKATLLPNKDNWIIPDDIDDNFDYSWVPSPYEPKFIWNFATQWQKTGGPKYIVPNATAIKYTDIQKATKLPQPKNFRTIESYDTSTLDYSWHPDDTEEFNFVFGNDLFTAQEMPTVMYKSKNAQYTKYINDLKPVLEVPVINYVDSIFDKFKETKITHPITVFANNDFDYRSYIKQGDVKTLHIIDNEHAIIPKHAKSYMFDKLQDYPYIKFHSTNKTFEPLDIIFFSNGEANAEENFEHLQSITKKLSNRLVHVKNVKGRIESQRAAAEQSNTPWYFLVNAKLKVDENFDFSWQPNRTSTRRHYIFRAKNILNNLEYGHMAMVANNKVLTLSTVGLGLDFTLEKPHEIVDMFSGIAVFNSSAWDTWRTAFREAIKLLYNDKVVNDLQSQERLEIWKAVAKGDFAADCLLGVKDAEQYFDSVNGEFEKLKLSYDWGWLRQYYDSIHP